MAPVERLGMVWTSRRVESFRRRSHRRRGRGRSCRGGYRHRRTWSGHVARRPGVGGGLWSRPSV